MHSTTKFDFYKITNVKIDGIDYRDYPDYCDAFIDSADYDGEEMTDEEIDLLNDNYELVRELVWESLHH